MKHSLLPLFALITLALAPALAPARPVRAVLVVQNHAGDEFSKPLSNIGSRLRARLAGKRFAVIEPNDRVGTAQNRGPNGEPLPPSSAVNLALASEGELLLTASIDEASVDSIGAPGPRQRQFAQMTMTIAAVQLPLGESVVADTFTAKSDSVSTEMLSVRADALYNQMVQRLVDGAAAKFLAACEAADDWANVTVPDYVTIGFGCNLPGANVLLDGLSRGTAGGPGAPVLKVRTWRGIHHVRIESDFMRPFETEAFLEDGTSFLTVLKENEEGRRLRREDRHFDILMDRIERPARRTTPSAHSAPKATRSISPRATPGSRACRKSSTPTTSIPTSASPTLPGMTMATPRSRCWTPPPAHSAFPLPSRKKLRNTRTTRKVGTAPQAVRKTGCALRVRSKTQTQTPTANPPHLPPLRPRQPPPPSTRRVPIPTSR